MPQVNRLTDLAIRSAPPRSRTYSLSDGWGLSILINPDRSKWWRFRYRYGLKPERKKGKNQEQEKSLGCGVYPEVGLKEARALASTCMNELGIDPTPRSVGGHLASRRQCARQFPAGGSVHRQFLGALSGGAANRAVWASEYDSF